MNRDDKPIGIFDSGVGGLTVMKQLKIMLPHESMVYFGDTARVPYGNKSRDTIIRYSIENVIFLMEQNIKLLVIACNTSSAHALEKIEQIFSIPVIGTIDPAAKKAITASKNQRIAVLGTRATVGSHRYQQEILRHCPEAFVLGIPCPLFVPLVEEKFLSHSATALIVKEYLSSIKSQQIDTIILGCTHYPLLKKMIAEEVGSEIQIVDPADVCAEEACKLLNHLDLRSAAIEAPSYRYFVSDDPEKFRSIGQDFLGAQMSDVSAATLFEMVKS